MLIKYTTCNFILIIIEFKCKIPLSECVVSVVYRRLLYLIIHSREEKGFIKLCVRQSQ